MKLFFYEAKKILIKQYSLFFFLIVLIIPLFSLSSAMEQTYGFEGSRDKERYLELIQPVSGILTEEKEQTIFSYQEKRLEAERMIAKAQSQLASGECTYEEYLLSTESYRETAKDKDVIDRLIKQYSYVYEDPENRALIPASSIPVMENADVDYLFLLCICFCCAFAFIIEHSSSGGIILKTTPDGQEKTMAAKIAILYSLTAITSVVLSVYDLFALSAQLPSEYWGYGIGSLEMYDNCPFDGLSIIQTFVLVQGIKLLGVLMIAAAVMITAHFSRNYTASIFPYIAVPVAADYVAMTGSQCYFLPTGLIKGYGYFFGDVTMEYTEDYTETIFAGVPAGLFIAFTVFAVIFVIAVPVILIRSGRNRITKKNLRLRKAAAIVSAVMSLTLLTSCADNTTPDALASYGGSVTLRGKVDYKMPENSRYRIDSVNVGSAEERSFQLKLIDKESGEETLVPFDPFMEDVALLNAVFPTEDSIYFIAGFYSSHSALYRMDLHDLSITKLYQPTSEAQKVVFGLAFDFSNTSMSLDGQVFSDDRNVFFVNTKGIYTLNVFGEPQMLIEDYVSDGLEFDGRCIYYLNDAAELYCYHISSGRTVLVCEEKVKGGTLDGDSENLYFETSEGEARTVKKAELID
ncbi:MAG: hypothetical protein IJZ95_04185 [Oscillospiraceae bacterium]|nr:hypothetical protein [Oscillospiraceae bacterium]